MLNRPRPRKLINVIKTSASAESVEMNSEQNSSTNYISSSANCSQQPKSPTLPAVPQFSSVIPAQKSPVSPASNCVNFVPRKPIVATMRKVTGPPPPPAPTFSDSPKSKSFEEPLSFTNNTNIDNDSKNRSTGPPKAHYTENDASLDITNQKNHESPQSLSPKSSGEVFLDAADKAADYFGIALLNSFKGLNLDDSSSVKISSPTSSESKTLEDDNPFADIMKKLKSPIIEASVESPNLMNEEPPESFEKFTTEQSELKQPAQMELNLCESQEFIRQIDDSNTFVAPEVIQPEQNGFKSSTIGPSATIKAAFAPNPKSISSDSYSITSENETIPSVSVLSTSSDRCNVPENSKITALVSEYKIPESEKRTESGSPALSTSPSSPTRSTGFRASILKHGLSALERIGKSTADAVVSTRNKLSDGNVPVIQSSTTVTPNYDDESSSFYDILKLYGGYSKLQDLQLSGVRASITMKLQKNHQNSLKTSSFDHQSRLQIQGEIAQELHPDRIMEAIDDSDGNNLLFPLIESDFTKRFPSFAAFENDEIYCIRQLLRSLENIFVESSPSELKSSNRRRHVICQISTVFCDLLLKALSSFKTLSSMSNEISFFTSQLIKYLQTNFSRTCMDHTRADLDQQVAIKLLLDTAYSTVPILQLKQQDI